MAYVEFWSFGLGTVAVSLPRSASGTTIASSYDHAPFR